MSRSSDCSLLARLICTLIPTSLLFFPSCINAQEKSVRIGILAFRDLSSTRQQWEALADYLGERIPDREFSIAPHHQDDLSEAVERKEVDFVLTQPEHFVLLRAKHRLSAIATLSRRINNQAVSQFGGVIFALKAHKDINALKDIAGQHIAAAQGNSLGGYRLQQWALRKYDLELPKDVSEIQFSVQPQDRVVALVRSGAADIGFVRTGLLESMIDEGKLAPDSIKIINLQENIGFAQYLSTELVPEWPLSAMPNLPDTLTKAIALALFELSPEHRVAQSGKIFGFSPPADYSKQEAMMEELRVEPQRLDRFDLRDVADKYALQLLIALSVIFIGLTLLLLHLYRSRQRLRVALMGRASLLDGIGEGGYGIDRNGICTFINSRALSMLGFTQEDAIGVDQHLLFYHHQLKSADMAMYKAKEAGRNALCFFDPAIQTEVEEGAELELELRTALKGGQFKLLYQPQIDVKGQRFGAEALIRWQHPVAAWRLPVNSSQLPRKPGSSCPSTNGCSKKPADRSPIGKKMPPPPN